MYDDYGHYSGVENFLPWYHPRSIADYAIYNSLFDEELEFPLTGTVPWLRGDKPQRARFLFSPDNFDGDQFLEEAMQLLYEAASEDYPEEYEGNRPWHFYQDWKDVGKPLPYLMDEELSTNSEDYPEPMDKDHEGPQQAYPCYYDAGSDSEESDLNMEVDNPIMHPGYHPKGQPRCN